MSDNLGSSIKENTGIAAIVMLLITTGGFTLSESEEEEQMEIVQQEFRDADVVQDQNYDELSDEFDELLALYNELRLELALIQQRLELQQ